MKGKSASPAGIGVLTVLTILLVLTLAVFSVLTYSSAHADLALSRVNADTVRAFYEADTAAEALAAEFAADSTSTSFTATLPITPMQGLYIALQRQADGSIAVLAWHTIPIEQEIPEQTLNVLTVE